MDQRGPLESRARSITADTPYQAKQVASHWGGTRNGTIVHWPKGIKAKNEIRPQFHHVIDVAPTVLELAELTQPVMISGVGQVPMQGVSMTYSFEEATRNGVLPMDDARDVRDVVLAGRFRNEFGDIPDCRRVDIGFGRRRIERSGRGVASVAFVKTLEAEPFSPFTFSPVAVSVYQLGNFGMARKKLREWTFTP